MAVVAGQEGEPLPCRCVERPGVEARQLALAPPATGQPGAPEPARAAAAILAATSAPSAASSSAIAPLGPRQSDEVDVEVVKSGDDRGFAGVDDPRSAGGGIGDLRSRAGPTTRPSAIPIASAVSSPRARRPARLVRRRRARRVARSSVRVAGEAWRLDESVAPGRRRCAPARPARPAASATGRARRAPRGRQAHAALTGGPQPAEGKQEHADAVAEEQRGGHAPVRRPRQRDRRQAGDDGRGEQRRHEELAGEGQEVGLAAERQRAEQQARPVLQKAPQAALRPAQSLPPERAERLDGLLVTATSGRQRDVPAVRDEPRRQVEILGQRTRVPAADRLQRRRGARTSRCRAARRSRRSTIGRTGSSCPSAAPRPARVSATRPMRSAAARHLDGVGRGRGPTRAWRSRNPGSTRVSASIAPITSPRNVDWAHASTAPFVRGPGSGSRRRTMTCGAPAASSASVPVSSVDPSSTTTSSYCGSPSAPA